MHLLATIGRHAKSSPPFHPSLTLIPPAAVLTGFHGGVACLAFPAPMRVFSRICPPPHPKLLPGLLNIGRKKKLHTHKNWIIIEENKRPFTVKAQPKSKPKGECHAFNNQNQDICHHIIAFSCKQSLSARKKHQSRRMASRRFYNKLARLLHGHECLTLRNRRQYNHLLLQERQGQVLHQGRGGLFGRQGNPFGQQGKDNRLIFKENHLHISLHI